MVATFGDETGLTCVDTYAGCYTSIVLTGTQSKEELRKALVRNNAKYLGQFNEVFKLKGN